MRHYRKGVALHHFSPAVAEWFSTSFDAPTNAQAQAWPIIASGAHTLLLAPTGSGKTLAAFLWAIDRLMTQPVPAREQRCRVLYVSPLKALAVDVEKNLRAPLAGAAHAAARAGLAPHIPVVGMRTGDTSTQERRQLHRTPPDILITTPESLYLMLTSAARAALEGVECVIIDEIHAVAPNKRGAHLSLSLERLELLTARPPQRIGLSATQRPLEEIARFLGGADAAGPRPVTIVDAGVQKPLDLEVIVAVDDLGDIQAPPAPAADEVHTGPQPDRSIWPHVHPRILELIRAHTSTLIFVNARRLAERLAARLNELADCGPGSGRPELVRAHHGSLAREQRLQIEDDLKAGRLRALVATSSLELGIDMGAVDLVIQVESPGSVARGLQRAGRAGHQVGAPSRAKIFPKHRGDLLEAAVVVERMQTGEIEATRYPRNPLDVLAQQIVAACALDEWDVDELRTLVRRSANFADLSDDAFGAVLDLLSGRYPSDEFSGLRPRLVWDRLNNRVRAREGAQRIAVTNGGTIPDRGLFGVFLPDGGRVGELDEEMVYESRPGETFVLGASTWRIDQITHDRVIVVPAPGEPGRMPFWHGDMIGRPVELGRALGARVRELRALGSDAAQQSLRTSSALDELAARNLVQYLDEQATATGVVPDDQTIVVERFPDEIGDWRVCILSPFGARVHAPWALALESRLAERYDAAVQVLWSDDGIVVRLPEAVESFPIETLVIDPLEVEALVIEQLSSTALFASHFREAASRALLLPKRRPGSRTPLWQQRQRASDLLGVASKFPTFPILLETTRECVRDIFDLPALCEVLGDLRARRVRIIAVETQRASPFAQSLLFGWIANYMYDGDAPLAERRAAALTLDRGLLRELLGTEELRELIDPEALGDLELELQHLSDSRRARHDDDLHDLLRTLGDLNDVELHARCTEDPQAWIEQLIVTRRVVRVTIAAEGRYIAADDAGRYRDALGTAIPVGLPTAFTDSVAMPLDDLVMRYARTHTPFEAADVARRFGIPDRAALDVLERQLAAGRLIRGEFRPGGTAQEWCTDTVLARLRRRSLAVLRREVEPVDAATFARFAMRWHGVGSRRRGVDALAEVIGSLQGTVISASVLEADVLSARVSGYIGSQLDELCASGEVVWVGAGPIGVRDGRIVLCYRDQAHLLVPPPGEQPPQGPTVDAIREQLTTSGASFWTDLLRATHAAPDNVILDALWSLVWAGEITNDSFAPVRAVLANRSPQRSASAAPRPGRLTRLGPPAGQGRWSLVAPLLERPSRPTERLHAVALQLLERHGVLTREAVRAEGTAGGFAAVYGVLRAMEETGRVRRGYFVAGLGAAQFALPGAVDRLRSGDEHEECTPVRSLAATDPAQLYGAALAWPDCAGRPARVAGAYVIIDNGVARAFLERGARNLITFATMGDATHQDAPWLDGLVDLARHQGVRRLEIHRVDGCAVRESSLVGPLRARGFRDTPKGLVLRT